MFRDLPQRLSTPGLKCTCSRLRILHLFRNFCSRTFKLFSQSTSRLCLHLIPCFVRYALIFFCNLSIRLCPLSQTPFSKDELTHLLPVLLTCLCRYLNSRFWPYFLY